ncbi:MAG: discoidin domain-containing protein [Lentisphaeria bacterium]
MKHYLLFFLLPLAILPSAAQEKAAPNLALHCLVSCSNGDKAEAAVDGVRNGHFWETPLMSKQPAWLELDLGEVQTLKKLHLFLWWGTDKRYYQYFIEVSTDRNHWQCVVDQRENTMPTDERGQKFLLAGQPARFIRLTLTFCSVNNSGHVRELEIY